MKTASTRSGASARTRRPPQEAKRLRGGEAASKAGTTPRRKKRASPDGHLRLALWTTAVLTLAVIFGAAAFHVVLVQSEFRLERLSDKATEEQQRYEHLRLEVARLAAPERIVAAAQERLGMIVPPDVVYLMAPAQPANDPASAPLAGGWSEVKPYLAARR